MRARATVRRVSLRPAAALLLASASLALGVSPGLTAAQRAPAIVPGHSVLGVQLGATRAHLVKLLGAPRRVQINRAFGTPETLLSYGGGGARFGVRFVLVGGTVFQIVVHDPALRTARGAHVGSTLAAVSRAYPASRRVDGPAIRVGPASGPFTLFTALAGGTRVDGIIVAAALEP